MPKAAQSPHILVLNGPNLNMLGRREPTTYGAISLNMIIEKLEQRAKQHNMKLTTFQSNHEGDLVDHIHGALDLIDGIIINPGALTHYGLSLRDALAMISLPIIEVHISNVYAREAFRHTSVIAPIATGQISGLGWHGYLLALDWLQEQLHHS